MFGLKLIWNWREGWKWASIQIAIVSGTLQAAFVTFPDLMRQYLPDWLAHWVSLFCFISIVVARVTATKGQPDVDH